METLKIEALCKNYGALKVLSQVNFTVRKGERRAIIGPNGAGKTTLFNLISGEVPVSQGRVFLHGQDITSLKPHQRSVRGLARTFQKNNLFLGLNVYQNIRLAVQSHQSISHNFIAKYHRFHKVNNKAEEIMVQLMLEGKKEVLAADLSYGEQRQLEIAVAVATNPRVLLLDEPTAGMSPAETFRTVELISSLPKDMTILIIEHDMDVVAAIADRMTVLHYGEVLADGLPHEVKANPKVMEVYLGLHEEEEQHASA
ncbi:MAG: ABC transporter ATP-binding protein [Carboxydocellales bacterium]